MTTCKRNRKEHLKHCNCTYIIKEEGIEFECPLKGKCCECIKYHKSRKELPACYFTKEQEKTYDRSIENFVRLNHKCTCHQKPSTGFTSVVDNKEVKYEGCRDA